MGIFNASLGAILNMYKKIFDFISIFFYTKICNLKWINIVRFYCKNIIQNAHSNIWGRRKQHWFKGIKKQSSFINDFTQIYYNSLWHDCHSVCHTREMNSFKKCHSSTVRPESKIPNGKQYWWIQLTIFK